MTSIDLKNIPTDDLCAELRRRDDCVFVAFACGDLVERFWEVNDNRDGTPSQLADAWSRLTVNDKLENAMADAGWSVMFDAIISTIDKED